MKLTNLNLKLNDGQARAEPLPIMLEKVETLPEQSTVRLTLVPVIMTAEERRKVRRRLVFSDGVEIGLALPTGTVLLPDTIIYKTSHRAYIVKAALEQVLVITPKDFIQTAKIAHFIGNLHRDIDMQNEAIVVLYEPALEIRLQKLGHSVIREQRPFMGRPTGSDAHKV
ncbi:MAG: urease accessory protein UreE [Trueperaceae bacterium]